MHKKFVGYKAWQDVLNLTYKMEIMYQEWIYWVKRKKCIKLQSILTITVSLLAFSEELTTTEEKLKHE